MPAGGNVVNVTGTAAIKPAGIVAAAALAILLLGARPVFAQRGPAKYTVQVGDTLSHIALKYNVSVAQLAALNGLANPDLIFAGQSLTIPGDSPVANGAGSEHVYTVQPGDTLFEIAARFGVRMTRLARANNIANVDLIEVGQPLTIPPAEAASPPAAPLPFPFKAITLSETRIAQGRTLVVSVTLTTPASLTMEFEDRQFVSTGNGQHYWGIVGVHALSDVGLYSVAARAILPDGAESGVAQDVAVVNGPYGTETIEVVAGREGLLEPEVIQAEADMLRALWNPVTFQKRWAGPFQLPVKDARITSPFGTRRSYGGGPVNGFHGGVDFGGDGLPIYAPAAGTVVLAGPLKVRGNAVVIDHGLGLYSGYWHQSRIVVEVGDTVAPGDLIGYSGNTGLVTGPHLHWEMRLAGIAVDPLQWVQETIP